MELPQATGLQCHKRGRERGADGEVGRVDLIEGTATAGHGLRLVLQRAVHVRAVARRLASGAALYLLGAHGAVEDVGVRVRDVVEGGLWDAEVLGDDVLGGVRQPVVDVEGGPFMLWSA